MCWAVCPMTTLPAGLEAVPQPVTPSGTDMVAMKSLSPAEAASPAPALLNTWSHKDFPMHLTLLTAGKIGTFSPPLWVFWGKCTTWSRKQYALAWLRDGKSITKPPTIYICENHAVTFICTSYRFIITYIHYYCINELFPSPHWYWIPFIKRICTFPQAWCFTAKTLDRAFHFTRSVEIQCLSPYSSQNNDWVGRNL